MRRRVLPWLALVALALPAAAGKIKEKEPGPKSRGKVYEWKASNGGLYLYYVPKDYDADRGANLVFLLHGSNGSRFWGMANIPVGKFRPDDIVVSPDGSTPNGQGGFNRAPTPEEASYLHTLHAELKELFKVRATFLYGHSQGSYFCHYYAAAYPKEVDGYVAMASGFWDHPDFGEAGHHQAVVVMHGTQDPVVPYGAGVFAYGVLEKAGFPKLHFRSLEGWNHWPTDNNSKVPHTAQQLAWCEGMTTRDPERLEVSFEFLADTRVRDRHDFGGTYLLAKHIVETEGAPPALQKRAKGAMDAVEAGARAHIAKIRPPKDREFDGGAWIGHLPMFLRAYRGVPERDEFAKEWEPLLKEHADAAVPHLKEYYEKKQSGDAAGAFAAGVRAIEAGFLHYECADMELRKQLAAWAADGKKLGLPKEALKAWEDLGPRYDKAWKEAYRAFDGVNRKVPRL